jgi:hypothetical protein
LDDNKCLICGAIINGPELLVNELLNKKDYRGLAAMYNSTDYEDGNRYKKRNYAYKILIEVGSEAVDDILKELELNGVGKNDLAELLYFIGDTRAVPLLKKMLDRGAFCGYDTTESRVRGFVERYPELWGEIEKVTCPICGTVRPASEMKPCEDKYFCEGCWSKRGRVLKSGYGTGCPNYHEGVCIIRGSDTGLCSLGPGKYYATECFAYRT